MGLTAGPLRRLRWRWAYHGGFVSGGCSLQRRRVGGPGRPSRPRTRLPLTPEEQEQVRRRLEAGPTAEDEVCSLRGKDVQRILPRSLACSVRCPACIICCIDWATRIYVLDLVIARPTPRSRPVHARLAGSLHAIAAAQPTKRLRVYFQDESRFGQQGTTTNVWARKGSRPTAVRQTEYEYLWVLGAVCPETGHAEGLLSPQLNTKIVNMFLAQFGQTIPADEHAVMLWDGAGFHASKQLCVPDNVTIVTLPAYSPELNPIENLWHYLKSHFWSNRATTTTTPSNKPPSTLGERRCSTETMKTICAALTSNALLQIRMRIRRHLEELLNAYPMLRLFTGDAIFAQRPLAELICGQGRNYLLQVKDNQGDTLDALENCFAQAPLRPPSRHSTNEGLSKKPRRLLVDLENADYVRERLDLPGCRLAIRVDREVRARDGKVLSHDVRYFV